MFQKNVFSYAAQRSLEVIASLSLQIVAFYLHRNKLIFHTKLSKATHEIIMSTSSHLTKKKKKKKKSL